MFEKIERCPICSGDAMKNHLICVDHQVSGESFAITKCTQCGLLLTNPRPTKEVIGTYYDAPSYISHSDATTSLRDRLYKIVRRYNTNNKIRLVDGLKTGKRLLDYGCGTGYFMRRCKDNGWSVSGLEPNAAARKKAQKLLQQTLYGEWKEIPDKERWDVITLWHVLEHVHELNETVDWIKKSLHKNGRLVLALPNPECLDARHYGAQWAGYDVPRHLYHFAPDTVKRLLTKHGLKIKATHPMKFDAYYVSLLSERSRNNLLNYAKGLLNGYKSNSYAKKDPYKFSSLIYIAGK